MQIHQQGHILPWMLRGESKLGKWVAPLGICSLDRYLRIRSCRDLLQQHQGRHSFLLSWAFSRHSVNVLRMEETSNNGPMKKVQIDPPHVTCHKRADTCLRHHSQASVTFSKPWSWRTFSWLRLWRWQVAHQCILLWHFIKFLWAPPGPVLLHSQQGALRQHRGVVVIRGDVSAGGLVGIGRWMPPSHGKGNFLRLQHVRAPGIRQLEVCKHGQIETSLSCQGQIQGHGHGGQNKTTFWAMLHHISINNVKAFP